MTDLGRNRMNVASDAFELVAEPEPSEDMVRHVTAALARRRVERGSLAWRRAFTIQGPAAISFSGGRTSAFMLHEILDAHDGRLPPDVHVTFANTGREMPATLDFVQRCGSEWGVPISWVEYRRDAETGRVWTEQVSHNSASRQGEPFRAMLDGKAMLPNPTMRFCTTELKIRAMKQWCQALGWKRWRSHVGLRADEPRRVAKIGLRNVKGKEVFRTCSRLARAGVRKPDVMAFWRAQSFDLQLAGEWEGNCDGCFLKSLPALIRIAQDHPKRLEEWSVDEETAKAKGTISPLVALFRKDRPRYRAILEIAHENPRLPGLGHAPARGGCGGPDSDGECVI